jgi:hypothetical protein
MFFTQPFTQLINNKDYRFYICDAKDNYTNKLNYTNNNPDIIDEDDDLIKEPEQAQQPAPAPAPSTSAR